MQIGKRVVEILIKGKDEASGAVSSLKRNISDLTAKVPGLSTALELLKNPLVSITALMVGLGKAAKKAYDESIQMADGFDKMSKRTDMSVEALARWRYVAELGGSSLGEFEAAFRKLRKAMADAIDGEQTAVDAFRMLGVEFTNADGSMRNLEATLMDIGEVIRKYGIESLQGAAAQDVLGRSSAGVVAVLKQGTEELDRQSRAGAALANNMTKAWADVGAATRDAELRLKVTRENMIAALKPDLSGVKDHWNSVLMQIFNIDGWRQLQEIQKEAAAAAAREVATSYLDSLGYALRRAPSSDNSKHLAQQILKEKDLQDALDKAIKELKPAPDVPKITIPVEIEDWASSLTDIPVLWEDIQAEIDAANEPLDWFGQQVEGLVMLNNHLLAQRAFKQMDEDARAAAQSAEEMVYVMEAVTEASSELQYGLSSVASSGLQAFMLGTSSGMKFGDMIRDVVIKAVSDLIIKLTVMKALMSVFKFFGIPLAQGGTVPGRMALGGSIPRAANGYAVPDGPRGMDSRLIFGMPGEEVINRHLSQRLERMVSAYEFGAAVNPFSLNAGGGRGQTVFQFNVARPVDVLDGLSYGQAAVTASRKYQEATL